MLSGVTDITDNNNEDSREKLEKVMPPKMLKRGRPRGAETTVIGLPKKKQSYIKKPLPFSRLGPKGKDRIILECLINERIVVNNALGGKKLVMPEELRCITSISDTIRDSNNTDVYRVERYFSKVAWENVLILLAEKEKMKWYCLTCSKAIVNKECIICERCLLWCHLSCTSLKKIPRQKNWFSSSLSSSSSSSSSSSYIHFASQKYTVTIIKDLQYETLRFKITSFL